MDQVNADKQALLAAVIKRIFRPIVKLMLANQLTYTFAADMLKALFVEVAEKEFALSNKMQTDSRVSLISGVHRKDVKRLRLEPLDLADALPENVSLGSQMIAEWTSNTQYLNSEGMPIPLARWSAQNEALSFETLARSVSKDIHPRAVLDEWLRLGVARIDENSMVHLVAEAFVPKEGFKEMAYYFGHNLHDHAQAAVANMMGKQPAFFERCLHYDQISAATTEEVSSLVQKMGSKNLREMYKATDLIAKKDLQGTSKEMRLTYGIYFYSEPMQPDEGNNGKS